MHLNYPRCLQKSNPPGGAGTAIRTQRRLEANWSPAAPLGVGWASRERICWDVSMGTRRTSLDRLPGTSTNAQINERSIIKGLEENTFLFLSNAHLLMHRELVGEKEKVALRRFKTLQQQREQV